MRPSRGLDDEQDDKDGPEPGVVPDRLFEIVARLHRGRLAPEPPLPGAAAAKGDLGRKGQRGVPEADGVHPPLLGGVPVELGKLGLVVVTRVPGEEVGELDAEHRDAVEHRHPGDHDAELRHHHKGNLDGLGHEVLLPRGRRRPEAHIGVDRRLEGAQQHGDARHDHGGVLAPVLHGGRRCALRLV